MSEHYLRPYTFDGPTDNTDGLRSSAALTVRDAGTSILGITRIKARDVSHLMLAIRDMQLNKTINNSAAASASLTCPGCGINNAVNAVPGMQPLLALSARGVRP